MEEKNASILSVPTALALLVNENAYDDFRIFIASLELMNSVLPTLYIYTTSSFPEIVYKGKLVIETALDIYADLSRAKMESMPSQQGLSNFFHDFTVEKCNLMSWAIETHGSGVLFCDADICWLGPLPAIPNDTLLGLSPHKIRPQDEARFGIYNAGFLYIKEKVIVDKWLLESLVSDFFEQMALNNVASAYPHYIFGEHINYGWWRMFQSPFLPEKKQAEWVGLSIKNNPLVCIHTHWKTKDKMTNDFNKWVLTRLKTIKTKEIIELIKIITPE
jgi:hypothetical protein